MSFWWCCCAVCWTYYDGFNVPNTSTINNWTEDVGDWEIDTGQLVGPATANSRILCDEEVPLSSAGEMIAFVDIYDYSVDDIFRLYVAWASSSDYYMVEATYKGSDSWDVELFKVSSSLGTATQTATVYGGTHVRLRACIDSDGNFRGGVISANDDHAWVTDSGTPTGRKAGLGHNNATNGATFDDFYFFEVRAHAKNITCFDCWCWCLDQVASKELLGTVTNATGRAACLNGEEFDLDYDWGSGTPFWSGTLSWDDGGTPPTLSQDLGFKLVCGGDEGDDDAPGEYWTLEKIDPASASCCTTGCGPINPLTTSTCDPINLVFGPFTMEDSDLTCNACYAPLAGPASGTYYITVTDKNE